MKVKLVIPAKGEWMEVKERLRELVGELYAKTEVDIEPAFPRVLVRLLPRAMQTKGGIMLPEETKQNKPVHEGVVLAVYKPFWQKSIKANDWEKWRAHKVVLNEDNETEYIWQEAHCQPGDHIMFPYMAIGITPVWPLDGGSGEYRMVPEGQILAKLNYTDIGAGTDWQIKPEMISVTISGA